MRIVRPSAHRELVEGPFRPLCVLSLPVAVSMRRPTPGNATRREELTLAKIDRADAIEALDVEGVLRFAERILPRASDQWVQASLDHKQLHQRFIPRRGRVRRKTVQSNRRNRSTSEVL